MPDGDQVFLDGRRDQVAPIRLRLAVLPLLVTGKALFTSNLRSNRQESRIIMADVPDSKSGPRKRVWVQVPPSVLKQRRHSIRVRVEAPAELRLIEVCSPAKSNAILNDGRH